MKHLAKSWGNFDREQRTSKTTNITLLGNFENTRQTPNARHPIKSLDP